MLAWKLSAFGRPDEVIELVEQGPAMRNAGTLPKRATVLLILVTILFLGPPTAGAADESIVGTEHWVQGVSAMDGKAIKLYVWEKRSSASDPASFAKPRKVVVLAHGAGTPGRVAFDLQVSQKPGETYSLMDYLASQGFDVFAVDYQNYGRSDQHPCGLCVTTQVAANDVDAAIDYIRRLRNVDNVYLLGWSWGTNVVGLVTMQHPEKVKRLVLYAPPVWNAPVGPRPTEDFRTVTPANTRALFEPSASDAIAVEAWVKEVAQWGSRPPNGVWLDLNTRMPLTDPSKITVPTMIILGELDRITPITQANLPGFFSALPNTDKQLIIVPGAGHTLTVQKPRFQFYQEVARWFSVE
jgi:pimeloyl-ACP methyl ester carboxylesterase